MRNPAAYGKYPCARKFVRNKFAVKHACFFALTVLFSLLSSCGPFDPSEAFPDDEPLEVQLYATYDPLEIAKQVQNYAAYQELSVIWTAEGEDDLEEYGFEVIPDGEYIVGRDIPPGLYYIRGIDDKRDGWPNFWFTRDGQHPGSYSLLGLTSWGITTPTWRYIWLAEGDAITGIDSDVILADARERRLQPREGMFLPGAYSVPDEVPPGEYFAIQTNNGLPEVEIDSSRVLINRFGYVRVETEDAFVAFENCVLMPVSQKPEIYPLTIDNEMCYGQGMYKIGTDIPAGDYVMRTDLFMGGGNSRRELPWVSDTVFSGIGYMYMDSEINRGYAAIIGRRRGNTVLRRTLSDASVDYEVFDNDPVLTLDQPGDYVELSNVRFFVG